MDRVIILLAALLFPVLCLPQGIPETVAPPPPPANALQGGWDRQLNQANAAQWQLANTHAPGDAAAQWNWFQSAYLASNSRNNGTLPQQDRQALISIADNIRTLAPNSFEHHMAEYYLQFPAPSAFDQLEAAYRLAPGRAELLSPMLTKALMEGDRPAMVTWSRELAQSGKVAPGLARAAQDLFFCLPPQAVVFTNGEMDMQPALVRQLQYQDKPGVLLVDRRLLTHPPYRARVWQLAGATGPVPGAGPAFAAALLSAGTRPVYFALGMERSWLEHFPGQLHAVGAAFRVGMASPQDATELSNNWHAMHKPMDAGPLSRNYLLPGAMLLEQARAAGQQARARQLEQELRRMASATGALSQLQQLGIITR